jgi:hypothetical protein
MATLTSLWAGGVSAQACTPPPPPTGLVAAAVGPNQINLSWRSVPGASSYQIFRSTVSGGPYSLVGTSLTNSFSNAGLTCDKTYFYVVRALATCASPISAQAGATTATCAVPCTTATLYSKTFEPDSGLAGWSTGTFLASGSTASWRGVQTCAAHGGGKIFRFGGTDCAANYGSNTFTFAQPNGGSGIAVPASGTTNRLSFWHRRAFESGFDGATLTISVDGVNYAFVPASAIVAGSGYNGSTSTACPPAGGGGVPAFTGSASFANTVVDLDAACNVATGTSTGCAGRSVRIASPRSPTAR